MKKKQIAKHVADKLGLPEYRVANEIDELVERLTRSLRRNSAVKLRGLGTVRPPKRPAKETSHV